MLENSRVAVLDLTHGGIVLARKLKNFAGSVTGIDVYRTLSPGILSSLENEGIRTSKEALNPEDFDILISPVHLDPGYPMLRDVKIPVISHHAAVGQILSNYDLKDKTIIEVTGTKAKTSASILLAEILSKGKKVVSHTSRGVEDWSTGTNIQRGLSITPASMLTALDAVREKGIEFDVFISEISLGGTGFADIGVITTIAGDYKIANNTRMASEAKRQMILDAKPGSCLVINNDALRYFGACRRNVNIISFSESVDASCNVYYENNRTIAYYHGGNQGRIHIRENPDYDIYSYKTAFVCAAAVALAMEIESDAIERSILGFKGAEGRMKKVSFSGRTLIDNSNSGLDIKTSEKALLFAKSLSRRIVMVLGEEAKQVCEGLEPSGVKRFVDMHIGELDALILVGERMRHLVQGNKIYYADGLSEGLALATRLTQENDIILSCVKCFR